MKPFFYALADIEGRPHFDDDCCVAEHPSELESWYPDDIEDQKLKIVPVYTGPQIEAMRENAESLENNDRHLRAKILAARDTIRMSSARSDLEDTVDRLLTEALEGP